MQKRVKDILKNIESLLNDYGESNLRIRKAISGSDNKCWEFLVSNELWGGSGSIADQGVLAINAHRKVLESLLIELGEIQISVGKVNPRTEMWVTAFREWA